MDEKCDLTRNETIGWIMHLIQWSDEDQNLAVYSALLKFSDDELKVIDKAALASPDSLRRELQNDNDKNDLLDACRIAIEHERYESVTSVLDMFDALKRAHIGRDNIAVHLRAKRLCSFVEDSTVDYERNVYTNNTEMMSLIDEYPDRMQEAMEFRLKRKTNDAFLIREYLLLDRPLSDGAL